MVRPGCTLIPLALGALLAAGCHGASSRSAGAPIDRLVLLSLPTAINLDEQPGSDGVQVTLYAFRRGLALAGPLVDGLLTVDLYDGVISTFTSDGVEPIKSARYEPGDLEGRAFRSTFGIGYSLVVRWDADRAPEKAVTLLARWEPSGGGADTAIRSKPATLSLGR